jgi:putative NADPH-quinone reductase
VKKRIVIIQGHPSRAQSHLGHALAAAYREAALAAGHEVRSIDVALLDFPLLREAEDWNQGRLPESLQPAQDAIGWAQHLVILFPLWTGTLPALFKGFFEQVARPGFAFKPRTSGPGLIPGLKGKSARVVVTMGMPAFFYRWVQGGRGVRGFNRDLLGFCGIRPVRTTYIGRVDVKNFQAAAWFGRMRRYGAQAE